MRDLYQYDPDEEITDWEEFFPERPPASDHHEVPAGDPVGGFVMFAIFPVRPIMVRPLVKLAGFTSLTRGHPHETI